MKYEAKESKTHEEIATKIGTILGYGLVWWVR